MVGTLGLLMFLYGVGIQYGRQFVAGLKARGSPGTRSRSSACWDL
jgi:putative transport protein